MIIQNVNPENGGQEGRWIALLCLLILSTGAILLPRNQVEQQHLVVDDHQVSIKLLPPQPLAMIADLRLAHLEIGALYEDRLLWPSVEQLETDWLAPFVKDKSWEHQGKHHWILIADGIYQGVSDSNGTSYLLNSQQADVDIWLGFKDEVTWINASGPFQMSQLIEAGWTQVVFEEKKSIVQHAH